MQSLTPMYTYFSNFIYIHKPHINDVYVYENNRISKPLPCMKNHTKLVFNFGNLIFNDCLMYSKQTCWVYLIWSKYQIIWHEFATFMSLRKEVKTTKKKEAKKIFVDGISCVKRTQLCKIILVRLFENIFM